MQFVIEFLQISDCSVVQLEFLYHEFTTVNSQKCHKLSSFAMIIKWWYKKVQGSTPWYLELDFLKLQYKSVKTHDFRIISSIFCSDFWLVLSDFSRIYPDMIVLQSGSLDSLVFCCSTQQRSQLQVFHPCTSSHSEQIQFSSTVWSNIQNCMFTRCELFLNRSNPSSHR